MTKARTSKDSPSARLAFLKDLFRNCLVNRNLRPNEALQVTTTRVTCTAILASGQAVQLPRCPQAGKRSGT